MRDTVEKGIQKFPLFLHFFKYLRFLKILRIVSRVSFVIAKTTFPRVKQGH